MNDKELLELAAKVAGMVNYSPDSGSMKWNRKPSSEKDAARWNARYSGKECGNIDFQGYRAIKINGKTFKAHRLAWLHYYGEWPKGQIDHINRVRDDNRIENLRDVTRSQNQQNVSIRRTNTSGAKGVYFFKGTGKWHARICVNGKQKHLGFFNDLRLAASAYSEAAAKYHTHNPHADGYELKGKNELN